MRFRFAVGCAALFLLGACSRAEKPIVRADSTASVDPLSDTALLQLRYPTMLQPTGGVPVNSEESVSPNGSAAAEPTSLVMSMRGDVTGDGEAEAIVILFSDSGESGKFLDIVPVFAEGSRARTGRATFVGDRVRPDSLWVSGGRVYLQLVAHGPEDPACCPSQAEERRYRLLRDSLALEETKK